MRYRMERFVLLPFSVGCISESSVAIGHHQHQNHQNKSSSPHQLNLTPTRSLDEEKEEEEDDEKTLEGENLKSPLSLPKFQRLFKNFKNLSHLFVDKDQMEEEEEMGMEIGLPTNVKHVTHIGIDGDDEATSLILNSTRTNWDYLNLKSPNNHDLLTQFSSNFSFPNMANHSPNHTSMATSS